MEKDEQADRQNRQMSLERKRDIQMDQTKANARDRE